MVITVCRVENPNVRLSSIDLKYDLSKNSNNLKNGDVSLDANCSANAPVTQLRFFYVFGQKNSCEVS